MAKATFDKSRTLQLFARIGETGVPKVLTFVNDDGTDHAIASYDFELQVYSRPNSPAALFTLTIGSGLTVQNTNELLIEITAAQAARDVDTYFWKLYSDTEDHTWLNGPFYFHDGEFDGVTETDTITITDNGTAVEITVSSQGASAASQAQVNTGTATGVYVSPSTLQGRIDTDGTLAANSDVKIPSQKAVKTYVDANIGGGVTTLLISSSLVRQDMASVIRLANGNYLMAFQGYYGSDPEDEGLSSIYTCVSTDGGDTYSTPVRQFQTIGAVGTYQPCLYQRLDGSVFMLVYVQETLITSEFYKVESADGGTTFGGTQTKIYGEANTYYGAASNRIYRTMTGRLLMPILRALTADLTSQSGTFRGMILKSDDDGVTWSANAGEATGESDVIMEPGIFREFTGDVNNSSENLIMYYRTRAGYVGAVRSTDNGDTWGSYGSTGLKGQNSMTSIYYSSTYNMYFAALNKYYVSNARRSYLLLATSNDARTWNYSFVVDYIGSSTITLTGTSGTANVRVKGVNYLATFNTSLTQTATDFVTTHGAALTARGITVTSSTTALRFVDSDQITITNASGNLTGVIAYNAQNLEPIIYESEGKIRVVYTKTNEAVDQLNLYQKSIPIDFLTLNYTTDYDSIKIKRNFLIGAGPYLEMYNDAVSESTGYNKYEQISGNGTLFGVWQKTRGLNAGWGYLWSIICGATEIAKEWNFSTNGSTGALTRCLWRIRNGAFGGSGGTVMLEMYPSTIKLASGTTAERPSTSATGLVEGAERYNTDDHCKEYYNGTSWVQLL